MLSPEQIQQLAAELQTSERTRQPVEQFSKRCLLYTSDAADERSSVDLGGRRIINKKKTHNNNTTQHT